MMCIDEGALLASLDAELDPDERDAVAAHIEACGRCRALAAAAAERHARVATAMTLPAAATDCDSTNVALASFRQRAATAHAGGRTDAERSPAGRLVPLLVAAALLAAVAAGLWRAGRPAPPQQATRRPATTGTVAEQVRPSITEAPSPVAAISPAPDRAAPAAASAPRRRAALRAGDNNPYILLTTDRGPPEMGMVVRIRVPLSMVAARRVMLSADAADPQLEADVLVGQDGRARAIRFVNQAVTPGGK